jgi:tetratricopeptide (TPR) repeat protein
VRLLPNAGNKLGDVRQAQGDLAGALAVYEAGHGIREGLAASDPGNAEWQRDLAISWERIASAREEQGERAAALDAWQRALAISLPMATAYRDSVDLVTTPVVHLAGAARNLAGDDGTARAELAASMADLLPLLRSLAEAGRLDANRATWADWLEQELETLRGERDQP